MLIKLNLVEKTEKKSRIITHKCIGKSARIKQVLWSRKRSSRLTPDNNHNRSWKNARIPPVRHSIRLLNRFTGQNCILTSARSTRCARYIPWDGFTEIKADIVQSSFWNFDALFQPQDHPAPGDAGYIPSCNWNATFPEGYIKPVKKCTRAAAGYQEDGEANGARILPANRCFERTPPLLR